MDDPRFSKVFSDPRFRNVKKKDFKVKLDDRFNKKDLKKEFTLLKSTAKVDKYGRKIDDANEISNNLDKYYEDDNDDDKDNNASEESSEEVNEESSEEVNEKKKPELSGDDDNDSSVNPDSNSESDSDSDGFEDLEDPLAKARGLVESDDSSDEEIDSEIDETNDEDNEKENIPVLDPTTRIAVVNLDWDHLNSTDLFATFSSFLPKGGNIRSVTIYKSEYGKKRLAEEDLNGPPREIFNPIKDNNQSDSDSDDDEDLDLAKASKKLIQENNGEEEEFNFSELRRYQLQRLRYYYAVVEFNNLDSSIEIYKKCDSTEYESSGNFFDLRYIPDDMTFDEIDIRDKCDKISSSYRPVEFSTDSLRNSKPKLTWDETPIERVQIISKSFKQGELDDLDLKNYLASDTEDDENEDNINKYKQLLSGNTDNSTSAKNDDFKIGSDDEDVDIEFTFTPSANGAEEKENTEEISTIGKLRQKEKERRKNRKQKVKELKKEAQSKKSKGRKNQYKDEDDKKDKLEIENIGEEATELQHFNQKDVEKLEKLKSKKNKFKNKRQRELEKELEERLGATNDSQGKLEIDDRFSEMIEDHAFAGGSKLLQQERKRRKKNYKK